MSYTPNYILLNIKPEEKEFSGPKDNTDNNSVESFDDVQGFQFENSNLLFNIKDDNYIIIDNDFACLFMGTKEELSKFVDENLTNLISKDIIIMKKVPFKYSMIVGD